MIQASTRASDVSPILLDGGAPTATIWRYHHVLIVLWSGVPIQEDVARLRRAVTQLKRAGVVPITVLQVLQPDSPMPSAPVRKGLVSTWGTLEEGQLAAMSLVLGGRGFWASAARAAINGMILVAQRSIPVRVDGSLTDALDWLPDRYRDGTGRTIRKSELWSAVQRASELAPSAAKLPVEHPIS